MCAHSRGSSRLQDIDRRHGVALMAIRYVLLRLQAEGLVSLEQGRVTFVRAAVPRRVLAVIEDPPGP